MNSKSYLNKTKLIIAVLFITSSFLVSKVSSVDVNNETLSPIYRDSSGVSSVFVINNTGTINGNFTLDYYLENDTHVGSENKQITANQSLTIDLSQSAPFANDPFTGYVIITADVPFTAEINVIPELSAFLILTTLIITTLLAVILPRKNILPEICISEVSGNISHSQFTFFVQKFVKMVLDIMYKTL